MKKFIYTVIEVKKMKLSICMDMHYPELAFEEKIEKAKELKVDAIEFWKWTNKDIDAIENSGANISVFNLCSVDANLTNDLLKGILNTERKEELLEAIKETAPVYKRLKAKGLIALIGENKEDVSYEKQLENVYESLLYIKPYLEEKNINLFVEPLNDIDRKNYFLPYCTPLFEIIKKVNSKNIKVLYDIYHQNMMNDFSLEQVLENIDLIGHFHIADCPGRHEPGTGDVDYVTILKAIKKSGFDGYAGFEFRQENKDFDLNKFIGGIE